MALEKYFKKISLYPNLSSKEENELIEKRDETSKDILLNSNLRFVVYIAKKYSTYETLEDLIQEGNLGLIKAIEKFDSKYDNNLRTYAKWWIESNILSYIRKNNLIKLPQEKSLMIKKLSYIIEDYLKNYNEEPSNDYLLMKLNEMFSDKSSNKKYNKYDLFNLLELKNIKYLKSLNEKLNEEDKELIDTLSSSETEVFVELSNKLVYNKIKEELTQLDLNQKYKKILSYKLFEDLTFEEIALKLHTSSFKVKENYNVGLRFLRSSLIKNGLNELIG